MWVYVVIVILTGAVGWGVMLCLVSFLFRLARGTVENIIYCIRRAPDGRTYTHYRL